VWVIVFPGKDLEQIFRIPNRESRCIRLTNPTEDGKKAMSHGMVTVTPC